MENKSTNHGNEMPKDKEAYDFMIKAVNHMLDQFEYRLETKGLLIVPREEWNEMSKEAELRRLQKKLLKKDALSFGQIIKGNLLGVGSRNAIQYMINSGKIKQEEVIHATKRYPKRIIISAIERLMK